MQVKRSIELFTLLPRSQFKSLVENRSDFVIQPAKSTDKTFYPIYVNTFSTLLHEQERLCTSVFLQKFDKTFYQLYLRQ
ncbi:hypothetical protein C9I99_13120 [Photobacterium lutimaris]|uniref:Uncharacterized protein n=1 Tax=Photobacterium lutimaris TaxID=388278 RepID=A0A2T3IYP6_9GAMM|nr:hypothetical protein C9I99_13120 [Photobacterium lutimaris]TDR74441.1 hypothetical protein DFP78_10728 [Photobacterium lutimaris]